MITTSENACIVQLQTTKSLNKTPRSVQDGQQLFIDMLIQTADIVLNITHFGHDFSSQNASCLRDNNDVVVIHHGHPMLPISIAIHMDIT